MSIKFPDLQVLLPRSHDTSRLEQAGQKHSEITQAQLGSQAGQELAARRSQVAGAEKKQYARIGQREDRGRRQLSEQQQGKAGEEEKKDEEAKPAVQRGLGRRIDIRI
ncbi:MAG: hypothetical protein GX855_08715 [Firmicutes bacterium]|nr:hypothetical protein [Bacillota bacterium]